MRVNGSVVLQQCVCVAGGGLGGGGVEWIHWICLLSVCRSPSGILCINLLDLGKTLLREVVKFL